MQAIVDVCMVWDGEMRHEYLYDTCSTFIAATDAVEENTNHDGCDMEDDMEADRWGTGYMYAYRWEYVDVCMYIFNIIFDWYAYIFIYSYIHM